MDLMNSEGISFKRPKGKYSKLKGVGSRKRGATEGSQSQGSGDIAIDVLLTYEQPSETIARRSELYNVHMNALEKTLEDVQLKFNDDLTKQLQLFIREGFEQVENVIPIGILESSLSVGETAAIFDTVEDTLKNLPLEERIFVSRIKSGSSSTIKAVMQNIFAQIIGTGDAFFSDDDAYEGSSPEKKRKDNSNQPSKRKHYGVFDVTTFLSRLEGSYKIVIILEDVDHFPNSVITEILTLLGSTRLPVTFIFGVTHGNFIQNLIPLSCSSEFVMHTFYSVSPYERFDDFMRRILFKPEVSFRVSGEIISYLESQYKEDNYSVDQIRNSLKFCLRYHFLTARSAFCSLAEAESYHDQQLKVETYYQKWETSDAKARTPRKRSRKSASSEESMNETIRAIKDWQFLLRLICRINNSLIDRPLGKTWASMYATCFEGCTSVKVEDADQPFHKFFQSLSHLSKNDFIEILKDCIEYLKKPRNSCGSDLSEDVKVEFENRIAELEASEKAPAPDVIKPIVQKNKKMSLKDLQKSLLDSQREKDGTATFHNTKTDLLETLKKLLRKKFPCFSSLENANIFVYDDLIQLINSLYPAICFRLNEDITIPGCFLQCECCSGLDQTTIDSSLPDVSILHKLLLEHTTRKVDLNLIYHAFLSVVQPQSTGRKSKGGNAKEANATASYLIRFRRAVGELQHMGFVKRAKSKPDEVTRLTWL